MNLPWYLQPAFMPARPQDLVLWLNSSSWDGTTWRNLAPSYSNVNHGTLKNGVAIGDLIHPSGVFGAPRKFDGVNDFVNCGNDSSLDITDAITIEAWAKWDTFDSQQFPVTNGNGATGYGWLLGNITSKLRLDARYNTTWDATESALGVLTLGKWHHVSFSYDKQNTILYVDGTEVKREAHTDSITLSATHVTNIGTDEGTVSYLNGSIDGVKIYNRALNAEEIVHNHTHSPIYYMQHGIDPLSLLSQTPQEAARVVV